MSGIRFMDRRFFFPLCFHLSFHFILPSTLQSAPWYLANGFLYAKVFHKLSQSIFTDFPLDAQIKWRQRTSAIKCEQGNTFRSIKNLWFFFVWWKIVEIEKFDPKVIGNLKSVECSTESCQAKNYTSGYEIGKKRYFWYCDIVHVVSSSGFMICSEFPVRRIGNR